MPRKLLLGVLAVAVVLAVLTGAAWAVDRSRGLEVGGREIGDRPAETVAAVADSFGPTPVVITTPDGELRTTAGDLGLAVDAAATLRAVDDATSAGPSAWFDGLRSRRSAPLIVTVDEAKVRAVVREKDPSKRTEAVEPSIEGTGDGITVTAGKPGRGLAAGDVATAVVDAARGGDRTVEAEVEPRELAPRFSRADAEALADEARALTEEPLPVTAGRAAADVGVATLRSWVRSTDELELALDAEEVLADLREGLRGAGSEPVDATVQIQGGRPVIVPGRPGTACCREEAPDRLLAALLDRPAGVAVDLPLRETEPGRTTEEVQSLGIVEQISSFTTRFPAGQSRVKNIHRIAEIVDGTIIGPGGRFSVNDKVGRRTAEKGFVPGGSIQDGTFTDTIGGGISQFATTLFNASFFGGLDMPTYQAHSIYISRYPYGREATLSFPQPDLVISNTTPYGVLVDTSYTATSVTVTLWSTPHAKGEQTAQTEAPVGACTRVTTQRTRTYVDGRSEVDRFFATYRPAEGVKC